MDFNNHGLCTYNASGPRLLIVGNHLPIRHTTDGWVYDKCKLAGIVPAVTALKEKGDISECLFFGTVRPCEEIHNNSAQYEQLSCVPISIPHDINENFYYGFCKSCLWPLMHYRLNAVKHDTKWESAYVRANEIFAQTILEHCRPGDLIWIHDYHLMLLPSLLRAKLPRGVPIGFFFHIPFPTSELFRILPNRKEILEGVLGADMIGFQAFEYVRHFQSTVSRLLGVEESLGGVESPFDGGHFVRFGVFPAGIDTKFFKEGMTHPAVKERADQLRAVFDGKHVLVGHDRVDAIEGVPMKLQALEYFFKRYPEYRGKVVLFQILESPDEIESEEQHNLQKTVNELVGRINGQYATVDYIPIEYSCKKQCFTELCALYSVADVALITPIRDGMNLASHEFVACQKDTGVLVLSEFTGAARCLSGARLINPFSKQDIADSIVEALRMGEEEKRFKYQFNYNYVMSNPCTLWGKTFLDDLFNTVQSLISDTPVPMMDINLLRQAYATTTQRLFFLDYDGTLSPVATHPNLAIPSEELVKILEELSSDKNNRVYVISGRDKGSLVDWLGHLDIGLSAEHGAFFRDTKDSNWEDLAPTGDTSWKEAVMPIMEDFHERTPGSHIERKHVNITWHYRNCDPEYGTFQARELLAQLQSVANKYPMEVIVGKKTIEAKPVGISKGGIVRTILQRHGDSEYIFCVGDDRSDEGMFLAVNEHNPGKNRFTCRVMADARCPTQAKFWVETPSDLLDILGELAASSTRARANASAIAIARASANGNKTAQGLYKEDKITVTPPAIYSSSAAEAPPATSKPSGPGGALLGPLVRPLRRNSLLVYGSGEGAKISPLASRYAMIKRAQGAQL